MKKANIMKTTSFIAAIAMIVVMASPSISLAAQNTVNLGTTSTFQVLAGSTITNTGTTIIKGSVGGDVGLSPGTAFTGVETLTVSGAVHLADAVAIQAKDDLVTAYNDAVGRTPVTRIPSELGGTTLTPGVYDSADGTFQITGTLTLDAQGDPEGVFIFKTASTLITASASNVELVNSARFCRTFWAVGSSATLGTNSDFVGHILAMMSITANTGATVQGQLLARNGAVTLDNNIIDNGICDIVTPVPTTEAAVTTEVAVTTDNDEEWDNDGRSDNDNSPDSPATTGTITPPAVITTVAVVEVVPEVYTPLVTSTVEGGQLPDTSDNLYTYLFFGVALILMGFLGLQQKNKRNKL